MSAALLQPNASRLERALVAAIDARLAALPVPIRALINPDTCPAAVLPFFAWEESVDVWDDQWGEAEKRAAIRAAWFVHRHKGTIAAVRRALDALNIGASLTEWFEDGSTPGTFRIDAFADYVFAAGYGINQRLLGMVTAQIATIKPARAHFTLRIGETFRTVQPLRTAARARVVARATIDPALPPFPHTSVVLIRGGFTHVRTHRFVHDVQERQAA